MSLSSKVSSPDSCTAHGCAALERRTDARIDQDGVSLLRGAYRKRYELHKVLIMPNKDHLRKHFATGLIPDGYGIYIRNRLGCIRVTI